MPGCVSIRQPLWELSHEAAPDGKGEKKEKALKQEGWSGRGEVHGGSESGETQRLWVLPVILSSFV